MKGVYSRTDGMKLFDLASDPLETTNLAAHTHFSNDASALQSEIESRYDIAALTERVLESQRRRAFLKTVMREQGVAWDHHPASTAEKSYVRNSMPIYELEKRARFPSV